MGQLQYRWDSLQRLAVEYKKWRECCCPATHKAYWLVIAVWSLILDNVVYALYVLFSSDHVTENQTTIGHKRVWVIEVILKFTSKWWKYITSTFICFTYINGVLFIFFCDLFLFLILWQVSVFLFMLWPFLNYCFSSFCDISFVRFL